MDVKLDLREVRELAYAENLDQNPATLFSLRDGDPLAIHRFEVVAGEPSYIAVADASRLLDVLCLLGRAFEVWRESVPLIAVVGKHGNPCGAAVAWMNPESVLEKALLGDSLAAMGGELVTNFPITESLGPVIFAPSERIDIGRKNWGLDIIVAPGFSPGAVELLSKREKRRLLANRKLEEPTTPFFEWMFRQVRGGFIRQRAPNFVLTPETLESWVGQPLSDDDFETLLVAWAVCWRASSNSVSLAKDRQLIALGCGQQDRIACVRLCLERANRAGHNIKDSLFASDGFFPYARSKPKAGIRELASTVHTGHKEAMSRYLVATNPEPEREKNLLKDLVAIASAISRADNREGPELLIDAGCKGGVVPADGKNLAEVKALFEEAGLSVAFVAKEHRGFANH